MGIIRGIRTLRAGISWRLSEKNDKNQLHYRILRGQIDDSRYEHLWNNLSDREKIQYIKKHHRLLSNDQSLYYLIANSSLDVKNALLPYISEKVGDIEFEDSPLVAEDPIESKSAHSFGFSEAFQGVSTSALLGIKDTEKLFEVSKMLVRPNMVVNTGDLDNYKKILNKVSATYSSREMFELWKNFPDFIKENTSEFYDKCLKEELGSFRPHIIPQLWKYASPEQQDKYMVAIIKHTKQDKVECWENTNKDTQKKYVKEMIHSTKDNPQAIGEIWKNTDETVKQIHRKEIVDSLQNEPASLLKLWFADEVAMKDDRMRNYIITSLKTVEPTKKFANFLGCEKENVSQRLDKVIQLGKDTPSIMELDLRILDEKILKTLGKDEAMQKEKLNLLTKHPQLADKLISIANSRDSEIRLGILGKCLMSYSDKSHEEEWLETANHLIDNMPKYRNLIREIGEGSITNSQKDKFIQLLSMNEDKLKINTLEELEQLDKYIAQKADKDIRSAHLEKRKNAVLLKKFGITLEEAHKINQNVDPEVMEVLSDKTKAFAATIREICESKDKEVLGSIYAIDGDVKDRKGTLKGIQEMNQELADKAKAVVQQKAEHLVDVKTLSEKDGIKEVEGKWNMLLVRGEDYKKRTAKKMELYTSASVGKVVPEKVESEIMSDVFIGFDKTGACDFDGAETPFDGKRDKPKYIMVCRRDGVIPEELLQKAQKCAHGLGVPKKDPTGKPIVDKGKIVKEPLPIVVVDYDMCRSDFEWDIPKTNKDYLKESYKKVRSDKMKKVMKALIDKDKDKSI